MRLLYVSVALAVALAGLTGCAKVLSAQDLVGSWTGKLDIADADLVKQLKASGKTEKDLPEAKKQLDTLPAIPLELKKDMTYSMGTGMGSAEGTWKYETSKITLTITKANGQSVDELIKKIPPAQLQAFKDQLKPMEFTVDKEGKNIGGTIPGAAPGMKLAFTKPAAASK